MRLTLTATLGLFLVAGLPVHAQTTTGGQSTPAADAGSPSAEPPTDQAPGTAATPDAPSTADTPAQAATTPAPEPTPPKGPLGDTVRQQLLSDKSGTPEELTDKAALAAFYEARNDEPLWVEKSGWTTRAKDTIAEIKKANDWGLEARDFKIPELESVGGELPIPDLVKAEKQLSLTVLKYARYARGGRITDPAKQLSSYLDRKPQYRDPKAVLDEIAAASDPAQSLRDLHPKHPQFERLRKRYLEMLADTSEAEKIIIVPRGPLLKRGTQHKHVALLRERLSVPAQAGENGTFYDAALEEAVKAFQKEKGTREDGIVGSGTRALLNDIERPDPKRLLANMEQWRWMPEDMGDFHVWVNVPEFKFRVVRNGKIIHEELIVAGEVSKQTPVFSDEIESLNFHPRWNVPQSIKVRELYPSMARGGAAIQRQGLRMMYNGRVVNPASVNWGTADIRKYHVYQPPGPRNVLGVVKFLFPNKHGVYMHDTSSKHLFKQQRRTFSHGCMRVRDPVRFAELILQEDQGWNREKIDSIIDGPLVELPVELQKKIPVHVTYFTNVIDDNGQEHLFKDYYGHEQRIKLALAGKWNQIAVGPDHLAPVKFVRVPTNTFSFTDPFGFFVGGYGNDQPANTYNKKKKKKKYKSPPNGGFIDIFSGF